MADDITLNAGSAGATLAADDISGVHHQRVKVQYGADGSATDVSDTNPLPIDDAGGSLTVDNAALSVTGGGVESGALRVTLANDSTGVLSVDDGGGALTVDGTVTANLSATDNAVLDQIEVNTSYGDSVGAGTEAAALRVTLATDCTGLVSVDDNGGSLTVDGTVTANLSATDNAVLDNIQTNTTNTDTNTTDIPNVIGTDGSAGPTKVLSVGGTESGGNIQELRVDSDGHLQIDINGALPAGTNLVGDVGISGARTSGGTTLYKNIDVDESEDEVKGSAGQLYWIHAVNLASTKTYLKIYDDIATNVTVGTTVPDLTFPLPTQGDSNGAGFVLSIPNGIAMGTGITIAATTGIADNDSGAPGANEVIVNLGFA